MGFFAGRMKKGFFAPVWKLDLTHRGIKFDENLIVGLNEVVAEKTFPHNEMTLTEQAAAYAKVEDGGVFLNLAVSGGGGGYTANYQLFPDADAINDAVYFGAASPFGVIYVNMSATVQTYTNDALVWEYYDGLGWQALTIIWDETDGTAQDGKRSFGADGHIIFSAPTDWAPVTVDSQSAYWVRARCSAANITNLGLTDSEEHSLVSAAAASEVPDSGTIGRARFSWTTVSGATADTKVILVNLTSGACSAIKTLTKAKKEHEIADFDVAVSKDDAIAFHYTDEDGTTEFEGGTAELRLVRS